MALPLPRVVADVGPGGGIVTAARGINALRQSDLENKIKGVQAHYAPLTTQAEAASKLAYANLMGPQFLAKLMGNPDILANIPDKKGALNTVLNAAVGQGNNTSRNATQSNSEANQNPFIQMLMHGINNMLGRNQSIPQSQNVFGGSNSMPGQPPIMQRNQSPQGSGKLMNDDGAFPPLPPRTTDNPNLQFDSNNNPSFVENAGKYAQTKKQMERLGTLSGDDIKEMNDIAFNANTMQATIDRLNSTINSPEFREIRQIPLAGQHEIGWYAKFGTPAQKRMIGQFLDEQGQIVVNMASNFKGAFRAGEQSLINNMKVNDKDMPEVSSGKGMSISLLNQMLSQRSARTAQLMEDEHISKGKAMQIADKEVDGDKIRNHLEESIKINIRNPKTGERKTVSLTEAKKMGIPNV